MAKFKKGDVVERINEDFIEIKVGDVATVSDVETDTICLEGYTRGYSSEHFKLVEEEKAVEQYYKNFYRALIEDTNTGESEIYIFVEDSWIDSGARTLDLGYEIWRGFKLLAIYEPPRHIGDYLSFTAGGKVVWKAESEQDKAKRLEKESKQAAVANMRQKIKELEEELDNLR